MTPEFGAASQLEKIDMLDFADFVAINKFDRTGAEDALRDVRKQVQRNREAFRTAPEEMPVFGTIAARFNDDGVTALYHAVAAKLGLQGPSSSWRAAQARQARPRRCTSSCRRSASATSPRSRKACAATTSIRPQQARVARERQQLAAAQRMLGQGRPEIAQLLADRGRSMPKPSSCSIPGPRSSRRIRATSRW